MGNKLQILRVRIKVGLPGQKWTNRTVVMTDAGELVAVLPENAYTESMTLVENAQDIKDMREGTTRSPIIHPTRKFLSEAEDTDPDLGW